MAQSTFDVLALRVERPRIAPGHPASSAPGALQRETRQLRRRPQGMPRFRLYPFGPFVQHDSVSSDDTHIPTTRPWSDGRSRATDQRWVRLSRAPTRVCCASASGSSALAPRRRTSPRMQPWPPAWGSRSSVSQHASGPGCTLSPPIGRGWRSVDAVPIPSTRSTSRPASSCCGAQPHRTPPRLPRCASCTTPWSQPCRSYRR